MVNNGTAFVLGDQLKFEKLEIYNQGASLLGLRTHHLVIALIAMLIAVALVSNYYFW